MGILSSNKLHNDYWLWYDLWTLNTDSSDGSRKADTYFNNFGTNTLAVVPLLIFKSICNTDGDTAIVPYHSYSVTIASDTDINKPAFDLISSNLMLLKIS